MRAAQRAAQEVSREAANKKSLLFLDPCSALKQGCEPAGWGEPWLQIQSQALGRLAGLARAESWLALLPPCLAFLLVLKAPFGAKPANWRPVVWRQCGERPGAEQWLWAGMWLQEMMPAREGEKKNKSFGLGIRLFFTALAARGMLGVEIYWKTEFFWQRYASLLTTPHCEEDLAPKQSNSVLRRSLPKICLRGEK